MARAKWPELQHCEFMFILDWKYLSMYVGNFNITMTFQPSALWLRLTKYYTRCWPGARCEMSVLYLEFGSWARMVPGPGCCCLCYKLIKLGQLRHLAATNNSSLWPRIADIICFHTQPPVRQTPALGDQDIGQHGGIYITSWQIYQWR